MDENIPEPPCTWYRYVTPVGYVLRLLLLIRKTQGPYRYIASRLPSRIVVEKDLLDHVAYA
eukprot:scaffold225981_cov67-Attheya_sp.AAC.1